MASSTQTPGINKSSGAKLKPVRDKGEFPFTHNERSQLTPLHWGHSATERLWRSTKIGTKIGVWGNFRA